MHLEPQKVIEGLIVSPDAYEAYDVYSYVYENFAGYANLQQLNDITDHLDELYKAIHDKISKHIKIRHANDTYIFHKWITPTSALLGSASSKNQDS